MQRCFLLSQIINTEYFAPILTVNQHSSNKVLGEIPSVDTFASLSNWLMRPVPTVTAAVRRFKERYFEDNYVIGEHTNTIAVITTAFVYSRCVTLQHETVPISVQLRPTTADPELAFK